MSGQDKDKDLDRKLEFVLLGVWVLVILIAFSLVYHSFIEPVNLAEKKIAEQKLSTNNGGFITRR